MSGQAVSVGAAAGVALQVAAISLGAAIGALLRWAAGHSFNAPGALLPLGTLLVNCAGGLAVGFAMLWFDRHPHEALRLFAVTGLLGALTTFSAFSAESLWLLLRGQWAGALLHTLAHVLGALGSAAAGFALARLLLR